MTSMSLLIICVVTGRMSVLTVISLVMWLSFLLVCDVECLRELKEVRTKGSRRWFSQRLGPS